MINLENLLDGTITDRNFQALTRLVVDTGGQSVGIRFGSATVTFTASTTSASLSVSHGLGRAPVSVVVTGQNSDITYGVTAVSATTFTLQGFYGPSLTGSRSAYWVAIG